MNEEINKEILDKIKSSDVEDEIKQFLYEIIDIEYDKIDEGRPQLKKDYQNLIKKYIEGYNDS